MPQCATAAPHVERGSPAARRPTIASGMRNKHRALHQIGQRARDYEQCQANTKGCQHGCSAPAAKHAAMPTSATPNAASNRCATPRMSPRFQPSRGPNGTSSSRARR